MRFIKSIKNLIVAAAVAMPWTAASAQFSEVTDIDDLALIYIGSQNRPDWTKDKFLPYVMHTFPDGTQSWKFDGFLMIDYMMYNDNGKIVGFGEANEEQTSTRVEWERLLDVQLGEPGHGCHALDELIGELIPSLGAPGHKHKVVFSLPIPDNVLQIWGRLDDGTSMNFANASHKVMAMKWYIDRVIDHWNACGFENLELDGIYFTKEGFWEETWEPILAQTSEYAHQKDLKVYWIPYWNSKNSERWRNYGVDVCYLQPGYYFRLDVPAERLTDAIEYAWDNDMGLEIEFEGMNYKYDPKSGLVSLEMAPNAGLYSHHPEFYQRLVDYIDTFEEEIIFDCKPIAYYSGRQAFYDFGTSSNAKDQEIMNRIALIINRRHVESGWDTAPRTTGIEDAEIADFEIAYAVDGGIYIADQADDAIVYTTDGRQISGRAGERLRYGSTVQCPAGIYIVASRGKSVKVCVK